MRRLLRSLPLLRLLTVAKTARLARRHFLRLDAQDRRRLRELLRNGRTMDRSEREELRRLLGKLEPRAFALTTANAFSPLPLPRWLVARLAR
jgi:hypothetical protein